MDAREHFAAIAAGDDDDAMPLAEGALWIAADGRPEVDVPHCLAQLDALATRCAAHIGDAATPAQRVLRLNEALFAVEGFHGNQTAYHTADNSYLDLVLARRTGIPITLSIVWIEVALRLGLDAVGVGFPGHFLAKVRSPEGDVVVDPFFGSTLDRNGCEARLREQFGDGARLDPRMLAPAPRREILCRVLRNLKQIHLGAQSWDDALACSERLLLLVPDDPGELRDRGLVLRQLECFRAAAADLERFLALAPDDPTRGAVRAVLADLAPHLRQIH